MGVYLSTEPAKAEFTNIITIIINILLKGFVVLQYFLMLPARPRVLLMKNL